MSFELRLTNHNTLHTDVWTSKKQVYKDKNKTKRTEM